MAIGILVALMMGIVGGVSVVSEVLGSSEGTEATSGAEGENVITVIVMVGVAVLLLGGVAWIGNAGGEGKNVPAWVSPFGRSCMRFIARHKILTPTFVVLLVLWLTVEVLWR